MNIRKFALVIINDSDSEIDRFDLDYADAPKNLGFEFEFTTLELRLTTIFTSAREKKIPTTININFLPPYAYARANAFKAFVQKYLNEKMVFEYYDTTEIKRWEGKVQKFGQEELADWGGLICPISFLPATPKYIIRNNTIQIQQASAGKSYPYKYPYTYGYSIIENNVIDNSYFEDIPLSIVLHGKISNLQVGLQDIKTSEIYSVVRFNSLALKSKEKLIIDAINSKITLQKGDVSFSAYDYIDKSSDYDSFLYARKNTSSRLIVDLSPQDTGYLVASYRQYTL